MKNPHKKKIFIFIIGVIIVSGIISILTAIKKTDAVNVEVTLLKKRDFISSLYVRGRIIPKEVVEIKTPISGKIILKNGEKGNYVKKGEILLKMDKTPFLVALEEAKVTLLKDENLANRLKDPPNELTKAKNELLKANMNLEYLRKKMDTYKQLDEMRAISSFEVNSCAKEIEETELQIKQLKIDIEYYEKFWKDNISEINAKLKLDKEYLKKAEDELKNTEITSPVKGIIVEDLIGLKEYILIGEPLFKIINTDRPLVLAKIEELDINRVKIGQKAIIIGEWIPANLSPLKGEIIKIAPTATTEEYPSVEAIIELENFPSELLLLPNLSVDVEIITKKVKNALVIPQNALIEEGKRYFVYTIENSYAKKKEVKIEITNETEVVIKRGLKAEDKLIISDKERISNGTKVKEINL
ncbi:MAG: efflux RND transporter periplasmic adaptor subunit [bacterium]|nr:efflux RND transporter periplasmic adaptor subunit [bacterium]